MEVVHQRNLTCLQKNVRRLRAHVSPVEHHSQVYPTEERRPQLYFLIQ